MAVAPSAYETTENAQSQSDRYIIAAANIASSVRPSDNRYRRIHRSASRLATS